MAGLADKVYERSPTWLQNVAVSAFGLRWKRRRLGGAFEKYVRGFHERRHFTREEWQRWQTNELRKLLRTALLRVPHYRSAWRGILSAEAIETFTLADLRRLPLLEKDAVRRSPESFLVDGKIPASHVVCATSGSTGTPVRTYWTDDDFQRSLALREARACNLAGVSYRRPRATFSGRLVVPGWQKQGPFHRFNVFERQVYFSAFHLSPANAKAYVDALRQHETEWGTGYTHSWELLGRMMLEQGISAPGSLKAIITTSEKLSEEGRRTIRTAFGCDVFQEYGHVEEASWACEGPDSRMRVSPDAGILEVLRPDGSACDLDEPGEVVATGFVRLSQPLIRYRLGDVATLDPAPDPLGLAMPVLKEVVGRLEDVVMGPDGRRTVRFHGIFTELRGCREAQVVQDARDHLTVRLVRSADWSPKTDLEIETRVAARFGDQLKVTVEPVEVLPRSKAGKFRAVINLVDDPGALQR